MQNTRKDTSRLTSRSRSFGTWLLLGVALLALVGEGGVVTDVQQGSAFEGVQLWEGGPFWATCNVGATKPEDPGYYFTWGGTVGYVPLNVVHDPRTSAITRWVSHAGKLTSVNPFTAAACPTAGMKLADLQARGSVDAAGNLTAAHDAATVHLGSAWRMPTDEELCALLLNCDVERASRNETSGYLVTGKGRFGENCIFLPDTGYVYGNEIFGKSRICLWSATANVGNPLYAWGLCHSDRSYASRRFEGLNIRAVRNMKK